MELTARDRVVGLLKTIGLNKLAASVVYRLEGFKTANTAVLEAIDRSFEHARVNGTSGDYLEFGVFKGASLLHAQKQAGTLGLEHMRFIGFDSFQGLPPEPDQNKEMFYEGQYSCGENQVRTWLSQHGADWNRMTLVPGFYDDTLTGRTKANLGLTKCAVAMLDCDIYSSTKLALTWLDDIIEPGSIVILDDWDAYGDDERSWLDGQRRAMKEHEASSSWVFGELFRYAKGLRGGLAFICSRAKTSARAIGAAMQVLTTTWVLARSELSNVSVVTVLF
jgi:O-methyltransferase